MRYEVVVDKYANYVQRLQRSYVISLANDYSAIDKETARVSIEALNCYSEFTRKTIECIMNDGTIAGSVIGWNSVPGNWVEIASRCIKPNFSGQRREEPKWYVPDNLIKIATRLNFGNLSQLQAATSPRSRVLHDLPCLRNYYAHRNETTKESAKSLHINAGVAYQNHPTLLMKSRLRNGNVLLEDWLIDLELIIRLHS